MTLFGNFYQLFFSVKIQRRTRCALQKQYQQCRRRVRGAMLFGTQPPCMRTFIYCHVLFHNALSHSLSLSLSLSLSFFLAGTTTLLLQVRMARSFRLNTTTTHRSSTRCGKTLPSTPRPTQTEVFLGSFTRQVAFQKKTSLARPPPVFCQF